MTPEYKLAQSLGSLPTTETEKIAHALSEMSIDDLEEFLLKEAACSSKKMKKLGSQDKLAMADAWGRELAREGTLTKVALPNVGGMWNSAMSAGKAFMGSPGVQQAVTAGRTAVGQGLNAVTKASLGQRAGVGAAAGGVLGGARGLLKKPNPGDPQTGQGKQSRLGNAFRGAVGGAVGGAAIGAAARPIVSGLATGNTATAQHVRNTMRMGRGLKTNPIVRPTAVGAGVVNNVAGAGI